MCRSNCLRTRQMVDGRGKKKRGFGWGDQRVFKKWETFGARDRKWEDCPTDDEDIVKKEEKETSVAEWNPPYLVKREIQERNYLFEVCLNCKL